MNKWSVEIKLVCKGKSNEIDNGVIKRRINEEGNRQSISCADDATRGMADRFTAPCFKDADTTCFPGTSRKPPCFWMHRGNLSRSGSWLRCATPSAEHLKFVGKVLAKLLSCHVYAGGNVGAFGEEGRELRQRRRGSFRTSSRRENAFTSHRVIECNELLFVEQCHSVGHGLRREAEWTDLLYTEKKGNGAIPFHFSRHFSRANWVKRCFNLIVADCIRLRI